MMAQAITNLHYQNRAPSFEIYFQCYYLFDQGILCKQSLLQYFNLGGMSLDHDLQRLRQALSGCLNNNTIYQSEQELIRLSNQSGFVIRLCKLIPLVDTNILSIVMTTLKNFILARYNHLQTPISLNQKQFLKENIFTLFYQIYPKSAPIKVYKQIMHIMVLAGYPWPQIGGIIQQDLANNTVASIYFFRQVAKANQYLLGEERKIFQDFISFYFPRIAEVVKRVFENFNNDTNELLYEILKMFYSSFHIEIPFYFRDFENIEKWLQFFQTILDLPSDPILIKNQEMVARIYLKFFILYANDSQDGKQFPGWAVSFRKRFCQRLFEKILNLICQTKGNEDIMSNLINCLYEIIKKPQLRDLFTSQFCQALFYGDILLPLCYSNNTQLSLFKNDPIQYVHRSEDLTMQSLRRSILDLIQMAASSLAYNGKSQMMRIVEYSAKILTDNASTDSQKEVVIRILTKIGKLILKNAYLKQQFQTLTVNYFIPLLENPNPLLNSLTCELLSLYLPFGSLESSVVGRLMQLIYGKITDSQYAIVNYNAILAFTALLNHDSAFQAASPHFTSILQIYIKMINSFEHENLISCLQEIIKHFSKQVIGQAPILIIKIIQLFSSICINKNSEEDDEPDGNNPANAYLSTISQLLNCELSQQVYYTVSQSVIKLFRGIFDAYSDYFDSILSLFNVLVFRANSIIDFNYPYVACRKLLQGDNSILANSGLPQEIINELLAAQKADSEFEEQLISILKNLIQKMPVEILIKYSLPTNPQLLLCIFENKRFQYQQACSIFVDPNQKTWSPYIYAYRYMIYNIGSLPSPQNMHPIVGVSLFPWLKASLHPCLIKWIVNAIDAQQQQQDDMYQQNTAQMLQKYANDDDESEDYVQGSGVQYNYLYNSPFDAAKDRQTLVQHIKSLHQNKARELVDMLSNKYRKKLEALFNSN